MKSDKSLEDKTSPTARNYHSDLHSNDKCFFHAQSRIIRDKESELFAYKIATYNFEKIGCYDCNGYNFKCKSYKSIKEVKG